jgi:hypothetical protein
MVSLPGVNVTTYPRLYTGATEGPYDMNCILSIPLSFVFVIFSFSFKSLLLGDESLLQAARLTPANIKQMNFMVAVLLKLNHFAIIIVCFSPAVFSVPSIVHSATRMQIFINASSCQTTAPQKTRLKREFIKSDCTIDNTKSKTLSN